MEASTGLIEVFRGENPTVECVPLFSHDFDC
jgi:hypothetical protein